MKLKLPSSVQVQSPSGENIDVSAAEVVEHVVKTGRELGLSGDIEKVRVAARILAALDGSDLSTDDAAELSKALMKPSRGWAALTVELSAPAPGAPDRKLRRHFMPTGTDLLPIVDGLLASLRG